jgi:transcriptional regulator with XRE-family HTH domain
MEIKRHRVSSGVSQLDRILGGLFIGDNVVWYDDAGSLASLFCLNLIQTSQAQEKPVIYVSFDRSPRNLLEKLGTLADNTNLTILDCFTYGKGAGSDVFLKFYDEKAPAPPCRIVQMKEPQDMAKFRETFYGLFDTLKNDIRIVFESLTGMQELWGGEAHIAGFYSHSCPRLYELNTIAYWVMEKQAHSRRLRAKINQIAQVAIVLSVKRGTTSLTILKAEERHTDHLNEPHYYWSKDLNVQFETDKRTTGRIDLGIRLKTLRKKRGLSQTELAKLVGVTSSTISQVESNLIYPSLSALLKMAEVLSVDVSSFFQKSREVTKRTVFQAGDAIEVNFPNLPAGSITAKLLTPEDFEVRAEPYLVEIPPKKSLSHFFLHKGEELGYVLAGRLQIQLATGVYTARAGDLISLTTDTPSQWKNPGPHVAKMFWVKIK